MGRCRQGSASPPTPMANAGQGAGSTFRALRTMTWCKYHPGGSQERIRLPMVGLIHCMPSSSPYGWCKPSLLRAPRRKAGFLCSHPFQCLRTRRLPPTNRTPTETSPIGLSLLLEHTVASGPRTQWTLIMPSAAHIPPLTPFPWLLGQGLSCPA